MKLVSYLLLLSACAAQSGNLPEPGALSSIDSVVLEFESTTVALNMPENTPVPVTTAPHRFLERQMEVDQKEVPVAARYPIHIRFKSDARAGQLESDFEIQVGAMKSTDPTRRLLEVPAHVLLGERQELFWSRIDGLSQNARDLHRMNFHQFELHKAGEVVWVRHLGEGILDWVIDSYSTPVDDETFLMVQFTYERDRWVDDKIWFGRLEARSGPSL